MFKQLIVCSVFISFLSACGKSSEPSKPSAPKQSFEALINATQLDLQANGSAAVSIAIYQDGDIVYADAFGNKQHGGQQPASKDTLFQIGSTTKMFTSLAVMQLVEDGMVALDDSLTMAVPEIEYLSEQPHDWTEIKISDLMTHQGGFIDAYPDFESGDTLMDYMTGTFGKTAPLMSDARRFYNYSNPNFSFLGVILERFTQQDYSEYMQASVFEPLGMTRSTFQKERVESDGDYALGVYRDELGNIKGVSTLEEIQQLNAVKPAGIYTWSTPSEVLKMADFLLKGNQSLLADNYRDEITKKQISTQQYGLPLNYGYGIFVDDGFMYDDQWYAEKLWQHGGNRLGYTSMLWILPEKNIAISILSSGTGDDYTRTMIEAIKSVSSLAEPTEIPFSPFDISTFDRHIGVYEGKDITQDITIEITNNGSDLKMVIPEFDALGVPYVQTLQPIAENTFIGQVHGEGFELRFFQTDSNPEQSVYIRNRSFVAIRQGS